MLTIDFTLTLLLTGATVFSRNGPRNASHSRIPAIYEVQKKIMRHFQAILNTVKYSLSNARIEATKNKIKLSIRMAYGFRNIRVGELNWKLKNVCTHEYIKKIF